jgi:NADP-dependent 3-hydroxy acid dehydrogenase YdfG
LIIPKSVEHAREEDLTRQFNVNFFSAFRLISLMIPCLKANRGQIIIINSSIVKSAKEDLSLYGASKHALAGFTESLRNEVNPLGIRVVNVVPGKTATGMQEQLAQMSNSAYNSGIMIQPYDIAYTVLGVLKLPQTAEITDIFIRPMNK